MEQVLQEKGTQPSPRKIRSYVLRQGRMTAKQKLAWDELWTDYGLTFTHHPFDFEHIFSRKAPIHLEIGFGMGHALIKMAKSYPEYNFVGIEVHRPGVGALMLQLQEEGINNVRVICRDAVEVLNKVINKNTLSAAYIYFPDPWHKRKHRKRRLIQKDFINMLVEKLTEGGMVHLATDWEDYANKMLNVLKECKQLENRSKTGFHTRPNWRPMTKFESRGLKLGHEVFDLIFDKCVNKICSHQ